MSEMSERTSTESVEDPRETITEIAEFKGSAKHGEPDGYKWESREAGYKITTSAQVITLAIDDESSCCESWGYFLSEDDVSKFVGADLRGVEITDTNLTTRVFKDWEMDDPDDAIDVDAGGVMFVNVLTDRGTLQFVAYNAHNGYYGHEARVSAQQLQHSVSL